MSKDTENKKKSNSNRGLVLLLILLLISFISTGYAAISANIKIVGTTQISKNTWDVHFTNADLISSSLGAHANPDAELIANRDGRNTIITYNVFFEKPGDYYEFSYNVKNDGLLDAVLDDVKIDLIDEEYKNLFEYELSYSKNKKDTPRKGDILKANTQQQLYVKIRFKKDVSKEDLEKIPDKGLSFKLNNELVYIQK